MQKIFLLLLLFPMTAMGIDAASFDVKEYETSIRIDEPFLQQGRKLAKIKDFKGKIVILNFWTTWCLSCKTEMPALSRLEKDFKNLGLEVVAVAEDYEGISVVEKFYKENKITNLMPYVDINNSLFAIYKIENLLPTTLFIDRNGVEIERRIGIVDWDDEGIRAYIKNMLKNESAG